MSRPCPDKPLEKGATGSLSASAGQGTLETRADKLPVPPCYKFPFRDRPAFTLIEMMVVITIMLILTAITVTVINVSMDRDRISDSGRTVQAFLEGARDRAIHAGEPRGVRFLLDPTSQSTRRIASAMLYIGAPGLYGDGLVYLTGTGSRIVHGVRVPGASSGTGWQALADRGRLVSGGRIRISSGGSNTWYTFTLPNSPLASETLTLTRNFIGTPPSTVGTAVPYLLELTPAVLPGQQPRPLARGIMIDLNQSQLPSTWALGANPRMDILFSPRGTVTGPLSGEGMIHLVLADVVDVENGRAVGASTKEGDELILTVTPQTGNISTHHVDTTDADANSVADDPFRFAELGEAAK